MPLNTPVLFLIYNRPEFTRKVFNQIKNVKPQKLFIAADGPKENMPNDITKCNESRRVIDLIDWDCEIKILFRDHNLGCGKAVSSALSWFFNHVEEGIILEDDCIPDTSFFFYCSQMLSKFKNEENVISISGFNILGKTDVTGYFFSRFSLMNWGWATWKRSWNKYDYSMSDFDKNIDQCIEKCITLDNRTYIKSAFKESVRQNRTWDVQWNYMIWNHNAFCIIPAQNLVANLGFGENATYTKFINNDNAFMQVYKWNESDVAHPIIQPELDAKIENKLIKLIQKMEHDYLLRNPIF